MPPSLRGRIIGTIALLAVVVWLSIGAALFVSLRSMHAEQQSSRLADIAQTFAVRVRSAVVDRDVRAVIAQVQSGVADAGITVHLLAAGGTATDVGPGDPAPVAPIPIGATSKIGDTLTGQVRFDDGEVHDYAALVLRGPNTAAARAILLSEVDRSAADAVRDVTRTLPLVILVTLALGTPLALVLTRSIARPLDRLAERASELVDPAAPTAPPLPLEGPTEVRALTGRVNVLADELGRTRARESELLADLRHDLRTPLTVIRGYATALADGTATGEAAGRAAAAIQEETGRLEHLVGELGAIDRLRTGADALRLEPIDGDAVVASTVERFAAKAAAAGVTLIAAAEPEPEPASASAGEPRRGHGLVADRSALDRILGNLVDNALASVAPGGVVRIEIRAVVDAAGIPGDAIAFSVADDGPGFPPGGTNRAFERFYRGDPARSGPGSGLGLSIVRELAIAHGGSAIAENLSPRGARVSVVLPVEAEMIR